MTPQLNESNVILIHQFYSKKIITHAICFSKSILWQKGYLLIKVLYRSFSYLPGSWPFSWKMMLLTYPVFCSFFPWLFLQKKKAFIPHVLKKRIYYRAIFFLGFLFSEFAAGVVFIKCKKEEEARGEKVSSFYSFLEIVSRANSSFGRMFKFLLLPMSFYSRTRFTRIFNSGIFSSPKKKTLSFPATSSRCDIVSITANRNFYSIPIRRIYF